MSSHAAFVWMTCTLLMLATQLPAYALASDVEAATDDVRGSVSLAAGASIMDVAGSDDRMLAKPVGASVRLRGTLGRLFHKGGARLRYELGPELGMNFRRTEPGPALTESGLRRDLFRLFNAGIYARLSLLCPHGWSVGLFVSPGVGYRAAVSQDHDGHLVTSTSRAGFHGSWGLTVSYILIRRDASPLEFGLSGAMMYFVAGGEQLLGATPEVYFSF